MKTFNYIWKGYGKSYRARMAEQEGKYPLTHAIEIIATHCNLSKKKARELILRYEPCEWHHTGRFGKRTNYYDTNKIILEYTGKKPLIKSPYVIVNTDFGFAPKCLKCGFVDEINQMPEKNLVAEPTCNCYE